MMLTNKELLESLREDFKQLEFEDDDQLNKLQNRGRMLIKRTFGEDTDYYQRFVRIQFSYYVTGVSREDEYQVWQSGRRQVLNMLDTMLEELALNEETQNNRVQGSLPSNSNRVFIVHGHDNEMKQAVARTVEKLGLEAVILHEKPKGGRTIIEQIEHYSDVGFAVALLSPDDTGYSNAEGEDAARLRARQNVVLELGYFAGKLGREKVVALYRGDLELPSDYDGVLYTRYDGDHGTWRSDLMRLTKPGSG